MTPNDPGLAELVKLAGSGSAPLLAGWAVYRIGRLETRVMAIGEHLGSIDCPKHRRHGLGAVGMVVLILVTLLPLTACLTPQQQEWTCDRAQQALAVYQTAEASGMVQDPRVIAAARLAAAWLAHYCDWQTPAARSGSAAAVDRNGVLIVNPP